MGTEVLAIIFLLAGTLLIFAELFIPSAGLISVMSVGCFLLSGYFAYDSWYVSSPWIWWTYLASVIILIPSTVIFGLRFLAKSSLGKQMLLARPESIEPTPFELEERRLQSLIGHRGKAVSLMSPGGLVQIDGQRIHAVSETVFVEANTEVEVTEVRGTRLVVRPVSPDSLNNAPKPTRQSDVRHADSPWNEENKTSASSPESFERPESFKKPDQPAIKSSESIDPFAEFHGGKPE